VLDESLSVLESLHQDIDLLVELGKVNLHVLLLGFGVLSLLVRVEAVHLVFLSWVVLKILAELTILLEVVEHLKVKIFLLWSKGKTDLLEVSLGVGVLLSHKSLSTLKSFSFNVVSSLWEEVAKVIKLILVHAHENDIGERFHWLGWRSLLATTLIWVWIVLKGLDHDVGLELLEDLIVSEVRELWKIEDWLFLLDFIIVVVIHLNNTLSNEVHFLDIALVTDDSLAWGIESAEHVNDQLVGKTSLALIEEMVERFFEFLENSRVLDKFSLHLWGNLLIENKLLNDQVEIIHEGLLNVLSDIIIESWLNMEWLVRFFNLLDPHVKGIKFLLNKVIEIVRGVEDTVDRSHKEREEGKSHKFKGNRENVFLGGRSRIVSVSDSCDNLKDPIKSEYVLSGVGMFFEIISIYPGGYTIFDQIFIIILENIWFNFTRMVTSQFNP
jgi:hypothetical protein